MAIFIDGPIYPMFLPSTKKKLFGWQGSVCDYLVDFIRNCVNYFPYANIKQLVSLSFSCVVVVLDSQGLDLILPV